MQLGVILSSRFQVPQRVLHKSKNNEIATEAIQMSLQQIPIGISQIKGVGN